MFSTTLLFILLLLFFNVKSEKCAWDVSIFNSTKMYFYSYLYNTN